MTKRFLGAASVIALISACSSHPGPSALSPVEQGNSAYLAGDYDLAERAYGSVLAGAPDNATAMLGLAEVYEQTGRASEATDLYRRVQAARSGDIRVWRTSRVMQDGVTEVASRRLGAMGHNGAAAYASPTMNQPMAAYPESMPTATLPGESVYELDSEGMVYYADPDATQPVTAEIYETPEAAMTNPATYQTFSPTTIEPTYAAPTIMPQTYAPQPVYTQPAYGTPMPAPVSSYMPAPTSYAPTPVSYTPAPISYTPAPMPAPVQRYAAPTVVPQTPSLPSPGFTTGGVQPGYAVVDGNFVYVSAEDIAAGAPAPTPAAGGISAEGYGVPVPISGSGIPAGTPSTYSAPRGVDVMNGIPMIDLN